MASFAKDSNVEDIYKALGKPDGKIEKIFESMKDVYMLSFLLGVKNNQNPKLNKKSQDPIKEEIFGNENKRIMDFIALYLTKDINILRKSEDVEESIHTMVEEYANGGIHILNDLLKSDYYNLDNLIAIIKEFESDKKELTKIDIADLLFEINEECK